MLERVSPSLLVIGHGAKLSLLFVCLALGACERSSVPRQQATRDSAAVSIIALHGDEHAPVAQLEELQSYPKPSPEPDGREISLYLVEGARRLDDDEVRGHLHGLRQPGQALV